MLTMRHHILILISAIFSLTCFSQPNHYIYLQTENKQPFYVKLDNKVYSSSVTGYVILSKLIDGEYKMTIGFPKHVAPEQAFNCAVDKKDLGFLIKDFGDKGWGLFNLQTMDVTMAGDVLVKRSAVAKKKSDDAFTNMLANVVHDSTINQKEEIREEPPKVAENVKVVPPPVAVVIKDSSVKEATVHESGITKLLRKKSKDGLQLVYVDQNDGKDTIRIFMPIEKLEKAKPADTLQVMKPAIESRNEVTGTQNNVLRTEPPVNPEPKSEEQKPPVNPEPKAEDQKPTVPTAVNPPVKTEAVPDAGIIKPAPERKQGLIMTNSDCKAVASEDDFLKLRKKMVSENNDDDMLRVAKKTFKTKCFTTEQAKNLSPLFLKDDGKYSFFETVYPFISDSGSFSTLEAQLTDPHYINRFRAMIQK